MADGAMNNRFSVVRKLWGALLLAAAPLLLSGCGGPSEQPPLAGARLGGPFTLTDQDGRKVSDTDFAGKYRLIYFGYTFCPDVCPVDMQHIMKGLRDLTQSNPSLAARIQPIFITIDPERDTPEALKNYTDAFPGLIALTGSPDEIAAVAKRFAIYYKKVPDENIDYLMDHSRMAMLFGPQGEPIALITQDKGAGPVVADLERWAR